MKDWIDVVNNFIKELFVTIRALPAQQRFLGLIVLIFIVGMIVINMLGPSCKSGDMDIIVGGEGNTTIGMNCK